ncbi:MAG TPA: OmcA/MtrC family decaheme c-type cytochrome [Steroidobacteraceae bacterium]|nr:OmcA/MtrC family decaheme c-type cytochrome [Steroidobacteraceae bacterium]
MACGNQSLESRPSRACAAALALLLLGALLAACSGSTGPAGPAGATGATGPAGAQGPGAGVAALDVTTATAITGTITGVAINGGPPVVQFKLADENGVPLKGLPAADLGWGFAQLVPGQNGESSQWNSYIYTTVTPSGCPDGVAACDTAPKTQATVESATSGALVDNGDGTYQYTFKTDITNVPNVTYTATLTHRVAFEIRGLAQANNAAYTFQPSSGDTTGIFEDEIVETSTCDNCHTMLSAHGGARVEVQYCVMCHNPGTTDPYSGNSLDMKVMIHKIHTGNTLPSIQTASTPNTTPTLGIGYWIIGYMQSLNNFNTVLYPQDTRNCTTCHAQNLPAATQAAEYSSVPSAEACGACHDNVNFATGENHSAANIVANDTQCSTCHGPTSTIDNGTLQVIAAHAIPADVAAANFKFIVNSVTFQTTAGNIYPVVNFSVVNPTSSNAPYNILAAAAFAGTDPSTGKLVCAEGTARLAIDIAWDTSDYTNWGSGATAARWGQPISLNPLSGCGTATPAPGLTGPDSTGAFTMVSPTPLPTPPAANCPPASSTACPAIANVGVVIEGHPGVVLTTGAAATEIPVTSAIGYGNVAGGAPVARRTVVTTAQCDVCHNLLSLHGTNRNNNVEVCVACHNPASTDVSERQTLTATTPGIDGLWEQSIDFKYMIHSIHDGSARAAAGSPFVIYGFGGSINNFTDVVYPGQINRCDACHQGTSFYPVNDSAVQATTFSTGLSTQVPNPTTPGNPISTSANMTVCSACHSDALTQTHMEQNGGSTTLMKDAEGRTILTSNPASTETCAICHGPGGVADVATVHDVPATTASN